MPVFTKGQVGCHRIWGAQPFSSWGSPQHAVKTPRPTCATTTTRLPSPILMAPGAGGTARWRGAPGPHSPEQRQCAALPACPPAHSTTYKMEAMGPGRVAPSSPLPRDSPQPQRTETAPPHDGPGWAGPGGPTETCSQPSWGTTGPWWRTVGSDNFRLVSLTPVPGKMMEKLIWNSVNGEWSHGMQTWFLR